MSLSSKKRKIGVYKDEDDPGIHALYAKIVLIVIGLYVFIDRD